MHNSEATKDSAMREIAKLKLGRDVNERISTFKLFRWKEFKVENECVWRFWNFVFGIQISNDG